MLAAANAAAIPAGSHSWFLSLVRPPGAPTAGLIAPIWAALAPTSGLAAWLAWRRPRHRRALLLWGWQLLACAVWTQCLLGLRMPELALPAALSLAALTAAAVSAFARLRRAAGLLLLPTLVWTCYAAYITAGFWWLNRG